MMKRFSIALALALFGCSTPPQPEPNWMPLVQMSPRVPPSECTEPPPPPPLPTVKAYSAEQSAAAFRRLKNAYVDVSNDYQKCQAWAKG